jgi:aminoglycoside phosphotransferase (APT) family kinase protein
MVPAQRQPVRPFDPELVKSFLGDQELVSSQLLSSKKNRANYKFTASDGKAYVLRMGKEDQLEKEKFAMRLVEDIVPVPHCLQTGKDYFIFPFMKGTPLSQCPEYTYEAAVTLSTIASVDFDAPGKINPAGNVEPWPFKGLRGLLNMMLNHKTVLDCIGKKRALRIDDVLMDYGPLLSEMAKHSNLVHGDFNPSNILIHDGKVSAVLDWEFAMSGSPYMDIGNLLRNVDLNLCRDVYKGLKDGGMELGTDWLERAKLNDISSQLVFLTRDISDESKQGCVGKIDEYLDFLAPE